MKSFSDHETLPIKGDSLGPVIKALKTADDVCLIKCEKHSSEVVKMYCNTCKKLICVKCAMESHKQPSHKTDDFSNSAQSKREELKQSVTLARKAHSTLTDRVKLARLSQEDLSKQGEIMRKLVTTNFQLLQEQLEKLQTKFLGEIDHTIASHQARIAGDITKCSSQAEASEHLVKMGEQALEHTSDIELLSLKRYMNNRLKELSPKKLSTDSEVSVPVEFPTGLSSEIMQIVLAHINHNHSPSLEASHAVGTGITRAAVGRETSFVVRTLTDVGEPCIEKQDVNVDITVARTGEKVPVVMSTGSELGTFVVKYVPEIKGEHNVAIRIEGNLTKRSPYSVIARGVVNPWHAQHWWLIVKSGLGVLLAVWTERSMLPGTTIT